MTERNHARWIVLKFGGTSVSTLANWRNIALVVRKRLAEDAQRPHRAFRGERHH